MSKQSELVALRRYNGFTQNDMAKLLGVDVRTYVYKEHGVSQFKLNEMFIISRKFNKPIDEIFLEDDFMPHEIK